MAWCLVTPASRGIGFALTRHLLLSTGVPIVATARRDINGTRQNLLNGLKGVDANRLTVLEVDVTDESTITTAATTASSLFPPRTHHLRLAYAIPGVLYAEKSPSQIDALHALDSFRINTVGPLLLMKHFSPLLPRAHTPLRHENGLPAHAVWASMSARVGSTTDNAKGGWYSYRASKAGVTSAARTFDLYLQGVAGEKAISIAQHPGTVKTDLSRDYWEYVEGDRLFTPEFAAEKLVDVATTVGVGGRGKLWDWKGEQIAP